MPETEAVNLAPLIDSGARHVAEVKKILEGSRGLIPVVWGDLYAADSSEGQPSPRVAFTQKQQPSSPPVPTRPTHPTAALVPRRLTPIAIVLLGVLIGLAVLLFALTFL